MMSNTPPSRGLGKPRRTKERNIFAMNLLNARVKRYRTQEEFAVDLNIKRSRYNAIEGGRCMPDLATFFQICHLLEIENPEAFALQADYSGKTVTC